MSLKAKLEAVIYAAEEPVTLAQLAALFAADAFEWKAQQEIASAEQAAQVAQPLPLVNGEFAYLELEPSPAEPATPEAASAPAEQAGEALPEASLEAGKEASLEASLDISPEPSTEAAGETTQEANRETGPADDPAVSPVAKDLPAPAEEAAAGSEADARRLARLRDREARAVIRQLLDELIATYASDGRGIEIREIAGGYRMATKPECHDAVRSFVKSLKPALRLSLPALETLAVIAYKQPATAPEVNEIRGVDSSAVFGSLLARKLIATAGRKPVIGRPILYKTTREFLLRFGLKDVSELPSMEEFEKMAAIELDEPEPANEREAAREFNPASGPEFDEAASEELEDSPDEDLESQTPTETAETAVSNAPSTPAEAASAAPPSTEQEETENSPHEEEEQ